MHRRCRAGLLPMKLSIYGMSWASDSESSRLAFTSLDVFNEVHQLRSRRRIFHHQPYLLCPCRSEMPRVKATAGTVKVASNVGVRRKYSDLVRSRRTSCLQPPSGLHLLQQVSARVALRGPLIQVGIAYKLTLCACLTPCGTSSGRFLQSSAAAGVPRATSLMWSKTGLRPAPRGTTGSR